MKGLIGIWWLVVLASSFSLAAQTNEGTEFWFSFLEHRNPGLNTMVVMITSRTNASGVVSAPLSGFNRGFAVLANEVTIIELPSFAETLGSESISQNGFRVVSDEAISVYIHQYYQFRAEATVVLPVSAIDNAYYAMSYQGYFTEGQVFPSEMVVVATQDETNISVQLSANTKWGRRKGEFIDITLNAGETYQIQGKGEQDDLSGSFISADKNFSLFCGNQYSALNCFMGGRDNLLEQAFPISTWGTQFVSIPFQKGLKDIFRILASEDNTTILINSNDGSEQHFILNTGEFIEYEEASPTFIETNKPVLVAQYMNQLQCGNGYSGDPSMLYLNSVLQIRDTVTLYNSSFQNIRENFINIISRTSDTAHIVFDGLPLVNMASDFVLVGRNREFVSVTIPVSTGAHTVTSNGCGVIAKAFGLGDYESYAYSGGASFTKINASPIPDGGCLNDTVFFDTKLPSERFDVRWVFEAGDTVRKHQFSRIYEDLGSYPARLFIHDKCFELYDTLSKILHVTLRQSVETDPVGIQCAGSEIQFAATDVAMASYQWTGPNDYFSEEQFPVIQNVSPQNSGIYEVIGIVSGCATFPAQVNVEINLLPVPDLGPDAVFCPKSGVVEVITPGEYISYSWSTGSEEPSVIVMGIGDYFVTVSDDFGCMASDSITFSQQCPTDIYIPNIFTPNSDGVNDQFGIFGEDIIQFNLRIFDKWGIEMFYTSDENILWDGRYKGRPADQGVYTWVLELQGYEEDGNIFQRNSHGSVTLIR